MTDGRESPPPDPREGSGEGPDGRADGRADDRPGPPSGEGPDGRPDEEAPPGIFPSWRSLYGAVLAWFVVVVVALYVLTVTLDFGAP